MFLENPTDIPMEYSDIENDKLYDSEGELVIHQNNSYGSNNKHVDSFNSVE